MSPQQTTLDEQRHSELFEGLLSPEEFRKRAKPGKRPPTLRTIYRWMDRGMVAWVQWGDQRFIDVAATRRLLLARVRRPERERRRRKRMRLHRKRRREGGSVS
jgi:hypothetical protein